MDEDPSSEDGRRLPCRQIAQSDAIQEYGRAVGGTSCGCRSPRPTARPRSSTCRPGPGYLRVGFAIHDGTGDFDDAWPSLGAYLTDVADVLNHGGSVKGWSPFLIGDGELSLGPDRPHRAQR